VIETVHRHVIVHAIEGDTTAMDSVYYGGRDEDEEPQNCGTTQNRPSRPPPALL
jgi:hypothetical protein